MDYENKKQVLLAMRQAERQRVLWPRGACPGEERPPGSPSLPRTRGSQHSRLGLRLPRCSIFNKLSLPLCEVMKSWRGGEACTDGRDAPSAFSDQ